MQYELRTALAKAHCVSLTRDVSEEALKVGHARTQRIAVHYLYSRSPLLCTFFKRKLETRETFSGSEVGKEATVFIQNKGEKEGVATKN